MRKHRRQALFLGMVLVLGAQLPGQGQTIPSADPFTLETASKQEAAAWALVPEILKQIKPPVIPDRDCLVTDFGADPDSSDADDRPAIAAAFSACAGQGGGRVVLPRGDYLSNGPIHFEDNIELHLRKGAVLRFGTNPDNYLPPVLTRWEGTFAYNYSPLLYASDRVNIAITGDGVIDGQTDGAWSRWKRDNDGMNQETPDNKPLLRRMGGEGVPLDERVFGSGHYLRPSLIQFISSRNILIEGVTLKGSPFWTTHLVLCENATVRGTTILRGTTNDDGIDPDGSRYVLIDDNDIHTHDDAIAIKSGRDADGRAYPGAAYVVIRNNRLHSAVGGALAIGSEMSGGVEWVFIENNVGSNHEGRGFYIKSNLDRGGFVRHVYVRKLEILSSVQGFEITSDYKGWRGGDFPTDVHDIFLRDVRIREATQATIRLLGQLAAPVRRIFLMDVEINGIDEAPELRYVENLIVGDVIVNRNRWTPPSLPTGDLHH